jgi:SAM-dependent methyltransferase
MMFTYSSKIFSVPDERTARRIILTPDGRSTDERWTTETPALVDLAAPLLDLGPDRILLDYGCGIGRMSKAFIERLGCWVVGVDISPEMRSFAPDYVASPLFQVFSREAFMAETQKGLRIDAAICIWVLQHCQDPAVDLTLIRRAMQPHARIFVVNNSFRAVPVAERPFVNDGKDVRAILNESLVEVASGELSEDAVGPVLAPCSYWTALRLPDAAQT